MRMPYIEISLAELACVVVYIQESFTDPDLKPWKDLTAEEKREFIPEDEKLYKVMGGARAVCPGLKALLQEREFDACRDASKVGGRNSDQFFNHPFVLSSSDKTEKC